MKETMERAPQAPEETMEEIPTTDASPDAAPAEAPSGEAHPSENGAEATAEIDGPTTDELQAELDAERDRRLRLAAEYQNYRRRTEREKAELLTYAQAGVVQQLLDVVDDFERSLQAAEEEAAEEQAGQAYTALKSGVELVFKKLTDELGKLGVEPIEAEGQPFDENLHDAMMQQPAPEGVAPGTVLQEFQKGYRMGDRVLRHSKVVVAA